MLYHLQLRGYIYLNIYNTSTLSSTYIEILHYTFFILIQISAWASSVTGFQNSFLSVNNQILAGANLISHERWSTVRREEIIWNQQQKSPFSTKSKVLVEICDKWAGSDSVLFWFINRRGRGIEESTAFCNIYVLSLEYLPLWWSGTYCGISLNDIHLISNCPGDGGGPGPA